MTNEEIKQVYNSFPRGQTMSFKDFRKGVLEAQDPTTIQRDLADIELKKAVMQTNKIRIDKSLN